jgi:MFS family permease
VQGSTTLPFMLLALVAGAIADNVDRRMVMLSAQFFMLSVSIALAALTWFDAITPWLLLAFTFLIGCGTVLNLPAWQVSVGDMLPREDLPGAVALNSMGFNIARSIGPAIGGAIVAAAGAAAAFAVNALSYVGLIAVLLRWRPEKPKRLLPPEKIGVAMGAGIRYAAMSPNIRAILLRATAFGLAASAIPALMPLVARDLVGGGALTYGLLLGAFGMGAVVGALSSGRIREVFSAESIVRCGSSAFAIGGVIAALSPWLLLTMTALLLVGAGWVLTLSTFNVTIQLSTPRWVVGRALATYQMMAFGGMAAGSWLWGSVASESGVAAALLFAAVAQAIVLLIGLRAPVGQVEDLNLDPLSRWTEPVTSVPIEPRSGPVVVTIEYLIALENIVEFLAAMAERRRVRRRDGARHWTLLRDLDDPELWVERYHTPTWIDYVRHNHRRTQEDAGIADLIQALHRGTEPPRVHRMIERQTGSLPNGRAPGAGELAEPFTDPTRSS